MSASIQVSGLRKSFRQADTVIEILKGLDLELAAGDTLAVQGESGSGKSTLLALLAGLDRPDAGEIEIAGRPITRLGEAALARFRAAHLGIVFQQFHLLPHLTALENVALPWEILGRADARRLAQTAMDQVGLAARAAHLPSQLSGGERQRVAIARALSGEPQLLLADEPSGSLDTRTGQQVMDQLFELIAARGTTLILVTHSQELARRCRREAHLIDGRLLPQPAPAS